MAEDKYVSVRLYLPNEEFKRRFQAACAMHGRKMSDVAVELIDGWLGENESLEQLRQSQQRKTPASTDVVSSVPTIASLIEETLSNRDWVLGRLAADAEMSVERINELLEGDRPSDTELQKLAQRLVKPDGEPWEEGELVDIRLAEDLKRRRQQKR
ncbi:plasmid partition protein ParG [Coleofasciculus sp. FACHB-T130]|uniref:plasmid partition protein ParG n=1 Tax=Cyanophyceae TaxID=3028117 RepID=UPI001F55011E|nr:plasmid partition protein ParG [Coleofasciculus sp. FACHB-T130]